MHSWGPGLDPEADLEKLKAEIGDGYDMTRIGTARHPFLRVTNRSASRLTEDVYCDGRYFWWSWAERICPVTDLATAAEAVTRVVRTDELADTAK